MLQVMDVEEIFILWFASTRILLIAFFLSIAVNINIFLSLHLFLFFLSIFFLEGPIFFAITNNPCQFVAEFLAVGPFVFLAEVLVLSLLVLFELALDADNIENN